MNIASIKPVFSAGKVDNQSKRGLDTAQTIKVIISAPTVRQIKVDNMTLLERLFPLTIAIKAGIRAPIVAPKTR